MRVMIVLLAISLVVASTCFAGINEDAKATIHVMPHGTRSCTKNMPTITDCHDIVSTIATNDIDFFPVFFDMAEFTALEYGVTWSGSTCAFTSCSSLTIGDIKNSGDGISQAWTTCQSGPVGIAGFGWISADPNCRICLVPHPVPMEVSIVDCAPDSIRQKDTLPPISLGCAGANGAIGDDPCRLSVEPSSWGEIKALFR